MASNKLQVAKRKRMPKTVQQRKGQKAGILSFGAVFALYAMFFPLYRIGDYVLCVAVSFLISRVVSVMATGLDLRTEEQKRMDEPEPIIITGDEQADEVIARGQEHIRALREENRLNPDEALSNKMDELERISRQILNTVKDKPQKAAQVRRFMDYYLPTTLKILQNFRMMDEKELNGAKAQEVRRDIANGVDVVIDACQRLLDNLYKDEYLDVSTDIDVLKQILKRDGLTGGEFTFDKQEEEQTHD